MPLLSVGVVFSQTDKQYLLNCRLPASTWAHSLACASGPSQKLSEVHWY